MVHKYLNFGDAARVAHDSANLILSSSVRYGFYTKDTNYYSRKRCDTKILLDPTRDSNGRITHIYFKDDPINIYRDYREFSVLEDVLELLLLNRGIWYRIKDPFAVDLVNLSWVGSDTSMIPKKFTTLTLPDGDKDIEVSMKKVFRENNGELIDLYHQKMKMIQDIKPTKDIVERYNKSALINRFILNRSQVGTRLTKLTRMVGDKSSLYRMFRSYGNIPGRRGVSSSIVPVSHEIDIDHIERSILEENNGLMESHVDDVVLEFLENIITDGIWVVKPVYGSHGMGMRITGKDDILKNFNSWRKEEHYFNNTNIVFKVWLFSRFVKSFQWKLDNDKPDSLKLCDKELWNKIRVPKLMGDDYDPGDVDTRNKIVDEETGKSFNTFKMVNPTKKPKYQEFRDHKFKDSHGRINKGRVWIAVNIQDGSYQLWVYKKMLFELCSLELDTNDIQQYNDLQRVWTDANSFIYGKKEDIDEELRDRDIQTKYQLDPINASRASDLDLCYMVDWEDGHWFQNDTKQKFPLDWNSIKQSFSDIFDIFLQATKDSVNCLSETNTNIDTKGCFQYFGIDFIIDDNSNVWLLEFNTRPWSGYGFWWRHYFDYNNHHMPNKYIFIESLIRQFVDTKFEQKPNRRPLDDFSDIDNMWQIYKSEVHISLERPIAVLSNILPIKGQSNWVMNRELKNLFRTRGWGTFPFGRLVDNPNLTIQGMTPYLKYLVENYDKTTFNKKVQEVYPYMVASNIVNRIFPLVFFLGDKARMVDILRSVYPSESNIDNLCQPCYQWDQIVPFTINIDRKKTNVKQLESLLSGYPGQTWIIKPSMGKQGTGIFISGDSNDIHKRIINDTTSQDGNMWSISRYIDRPFLTQGRKTHIRTFVLVSIEGGNLKTFVMDPHLLFMAGLPYDIDNAKMFANNYFNDKILNGLKGNRKQLVKKFDEYRTLTNLSKGASMIKKWVDCGKVISISNSTYDNKSVLGKISNSCKNPEKMDNVGYEALSGDARKMIDTEKGERFFDENLLPQIQQIIKQTIYAIRNDIDCVNKKTNQCYQYIALDFMMEETDSIPKVWLLEVNVNPGLKSPTKLLTGGIKRFMNSIFDHTLGDHNDTFIFTASNGNQYHVPKKMRKMSQVDLEKETRKMVPSRDNLFHELLTLEINANEKSEELVRNSYIIDKMSGSQQQQQQQEPSWFDKLKEARKKMFDRSGTQVQAIMSHQMGLPWHDLAFRSQFMRGMVPFMDMGIEMGLGPWNSPLLDADNKDFGEYLMDLHIWQMQMAVNEKMREGLKDSKGLPYWILFPGFFDMGIFGFGARRRKTRRRKRSNQMERFFEQWGMMHFLNSQTPEAAFIVGFGMGDLGMQIGFPYFTDGAIRDIEKAMKHYGRSYPFCQLYDKKSLKNLFDLFMIPYGARDSKEALCGRLLLLNHMGFLTPEFPFMNQTFMGPGFQRLDLGDNPFASMFEIQALQSIFGPYSFKYIHDKYGKPAVTSGGDQNP